MSVFVRKTKTASGATAVQIVYKRGTTITKIDHLGSAHNDDDVALLVALGKQRINEHQLSLFEPDHRPHPGAVVLRASSRYLYEQLESEWTDLGFSAVGDEVFQQIVLARIVEPVSKLDTIRVLDQLGVVSPSKDQIYRSLRKCVKGNYRQLMAHACIERSKAGISLLLYDVTTLYFEIQREDEFRKPGYSKERRLEPQILVGLLVDQAGFPLMVHSFVGNKSETLTILPVINEFVATNKLNKPTIVADAAMLSASNLEALEDGGFSFIVGSRITKTPYEINEHKKVTPIIEDGAIFESRVDMGKGERSRSRRIVYQYREKRARLDLTNIEKQLAKANRVIRGDLPITRTRFVKVVNSKRQVDEHLVAENRKRAGIKGYVTNLVDVDATTVIDHYHKLFEVERSFRMSKTDLKARPIFHRKEDSINAHLTVVFGALAIARTIQARTGLSIRRYLQLLRPLQTATIRINDRILELPPEIPSDIRDLERGN